MPMKVEELKQSHLGDAANLFEASFRRERADTQILDETFGTAARVLPKFMSCIQANPGVAVSDNGKLIGYMVGFQMDNFLGLHRGVYVPEWGHGSAEKNAFEIYRLMYTALGQRWVENGCLTHAINIMNHARDTQEAFVWNGFGGICFDAIRPVERIVVDRPGTVQITLADADNLDALLPMEAASARHLAGSPSFIPQLEPETPEALAASFKEQGNHAWIAWSGDEALGYMRVTPTGNGAAWMVNGQSKFAINGAYVVPEHRGTGIARLLLSTIMDWGLEHGFVRCSVDFEATNPEACKFWLKHFKPVCRSFVRRLDDRILKTI
jgi:GNAT superfamily N-acetyltransferase